MPLRSSLHPTAAGPREHRRPVTLPDCRRAILTNGQSPKTQLPTVIRAVHECVGVRGPQGDVRQAGLSQSSTDGAEPDTTFTLARHLYRSSRSIRLDLS